MTRSRSSNVQRSPPLTLYRNRTPVLASACRNEPSVALYIPRRHDPKQHHRRFAKGYGSAQPATKSRPFAIGDYQQGKEMAPPA
jgi:hypothetical protein